MAGPKPQLKILGDHMVSEYIKDVKISDILGVPYEFTHASSATTLALELDSRGSETVTVLCCMSSIFDGIMLSDASSSTGAFERLRLIFDSYLTKHHELYVYPPLSWSPSRVNKQYQDMYSRFGQFILGYSSRQPQLKVMKGVVVSDRWFQADGMRLKHEYGVQYVTHMFQTLRKCFDRGGLMSISDSLEKDMRAILDEDKDDDVFKSNEPMDQQDQMAQQAQELRRLSFSECQIKKNVSHSLNVSSHLPGLVA